MIELLKKHYGYTQFRPLQKEVIDDVMAGGDALVLMPTGGGKSLCYQLPALKLPGITLVISPLISLMKDQVDALRANGIAASYINSALDRSEIVHIEDEARKGKIKLLYLAPERIAMSQTQEFLRSIKVSLIAVDEAHCISEWGHDFRPEYRNLVMLRRKFASVPIIALTATANPRVKLDIMKQLEIDSSKVFQSSFNRPNLTYRVIPKRDSFDRLMDELAERKEQSVIIYCFSRKSTDALAERLTLNNIPALPYHAGLTHLARARAQEKFIRDEINVITATIAFGMGIDKPDVRLVVHMDMPKSLEGYYQETGRAGRDGLPSDCLLFFSAGDRIKHEIFIQQMSDEDEQKRARRQLYDMVSYCQRTTCRRAYLLKYFGEAWDVPNCGACDICAPKEAPVKKETKTVGDPGLFEALRVVRRSIAVDLGVPPYMVFGDRTLQDMANRWPRTLADMSRVFGVGQTKLEQFGQQFLNEIARYASTHGWPSVPTATAVATAVAPPTPRRRSLSESITASTKLLESKHTLEEIARLRSLAIGTIMQHLETALQSGQPLDFSHISFDAQRLKTIEDAFKKVGISALAPVRSRLGESYGYDELRLARLILKARERG
jgi:RecQ family ATP-dependent DNA helicase